MNQLQLALRPMKSHNRSSALAELFAWCSLLIHVKVNWTRRGSICTCYSPLTTAFPSIHQHLPDLWGAVKTLSILPSWQGHSNHSLSTRLPSSTNLRDIKVHSCLGPTVFSSLPAMRPPLCVNRYIEYDCIFYLCILQSTNSCHSSCSHCSRHNPAVFVLP